MKDYSEFPPFKYFIRTLKNCPRSSYLYLQIWKNKGENMTLETDKKEIRKEYLISPTMFRNLMAPLVFLNLIQVIENDGKFEIEVLGQPLNE